MSDTGLVSLFNTHVERIAATPAAVWAMFLDRSQWMESFVSRTLLSGVDGAAGAKAEVRMDVPSSRTRIEELLHVDEFRRQVVRISAPSADALAHADFQFDEQDGHCRLQVSIHTFLGSQTRIPVEALQQATDEKLRLDFARLRQAVERT